jgi:CRISPR-associated protein Cas2
MVMFDLPVQTKAERRNATAFRLHLLDLGYQRTQLSVYSRFSPSVSSVLPAINSIKRHLPDGGEVRILSLTDHQWATALRFCNAKGVGVDDAPSQLAIL